VADLAIFDRRSAIPHSRCFPLQVNPLFQPPIPLPVALFYFRLKPYILRLHDLSIQFTDQRILFPVSLIRFLYILLCSLKYMIRPSNLPFCATGQSAFFLSPGTSTPQIPFVFNLTRVWDILQLSTDLWTSFPAPFATCDSPTLSQSPLPVAFCFYR
jgi:hypothetical protein